MVRAFLIRALGALVLMLLFVFFFRHFILCGMRCGNEKSFSLVGGGAAQRVSHQNNGIS